jgi:hypothetical protein
LLLSFLSYGAKVPYYFFSRLPKCSTVADNAADTKTAVKENPDNIIIIVKIFVASTIGYRSPYPTVKNVITTKYSESPHVLIGRL